MTTLYRKASRVIDIMCRLVQEPSDVAPFMPLLLPALDKVRTLPYSHYSPPLSFEALL
jgi:hypothetical protein